MLPACTQQRSRNTWQQRSAMPAETSCLPRKALDSSQSPVHCSAAACHSHEAKQRSSSSSAAPAQEGPPLVCLALEGGRVGVGEREELERGHAVVQRVRGVLVVAPDAQVPAARHSVRVGRVCCSSGSV